MRILAISAHPDDETLGCGGTLLKHKAAGDSLFWFIATVCHEPQWPAALIERKAHEVERVARAYGVEKLFRPGLPDAQLDTVPIGELMKPLSAAIEEARPEIIYLLHGGDIHTDHGALHTAALSVLKPFYMKRLGVRRVLCYEILSSTEAAPPRSERAFLPSVFSDITPYLEEKIEIMRLFESEIHQDPMPRGPSALRALARFRGATISTEYAEAFMLIRELM
jgi:LmbE family N-acetylglucosaminyl deacetylase